MALCISDPHQPNCPIVHANGAFSELTGYALDEIVGRNCRFLQGPKTDPHSVDKLRSAIQNEDYAVVDLINYRKDGTEFWNAVHIGPVYDEDGKLAYFFGSQWDISELLAGRETIAESQRVVDELRHRTDNLFAVLTAIVRLSARGATDVGEFSEKIQRRIEALANAHRISLAEEGLGNDRTTLRNLVAAVMQPYKNAYLDRIELIGGSIDLPRKHLTPIGLTLHELATNALKYGALSQNDGKVHIDWEISDDTIELHWIETCGNEFSEPVRQSGNAGKGTGSRLIEGVIRGIAGTVETSAWPSGYRATITIPNLAP